MATRRTSSGEIRINQSGRWRPNDRRGRQCRYTFRGETCARRGAHYCEPRASKVIRFFAELLQHTRGAWARTPFVLEDWEREEIIKPLFGEVIWSAEHDRYVRRYRVAYLIMARKNGKSELAAGIQLYMLVGDGEEAAEIYSAAKDTKQAGKTFEPALRMVQLSQELRQIVKYNRNARRLIYEHKASIYEILTADAAGELGHNPHSFHLDEVLSQPDGSMWTAMSTAVGARVQELMFATSTETNDSTSFGAGMIDEAERVVEDPTRAPHIFAFVRKLPSTDDGIDRLTRLFPGHPHLPVSTDVWDERNWKWANPALDRFKSRDAMRRQAMEAQASPEAENGFRQYQVNQRVQQVERFIPLDLWDANIGELMLNPHWWDDRLAGRKCWGGLDLSSKLDLTAWALLFDREVLWRFWVPGAVVGGLSKATDGAFARWIKDGWITETDGDTIDYERIYADLAADAERYAIARISYDRWSGEPVRQRIEADTGVEMLESGTTFQQMSGPMTELMRLLKAGEIDHGGNPVARWMADNLDAKRPRDDPDRLRPVKPDRAKSSVRIDGMPALCFAIDARLTDKPAPVSAYDSHGLVVI